MVDEPSEEREHWSGALGFILAAVGSAVGLGNIWRFPFVAGQNGGGAFVLIYLGCIAIIGLPLLIAEMKLGRRTDHGPVGAYTGLAAPELSGDHVAQFLSLVVGGVLVVGICYGALIYGGFVGVGLVLTPLVAGFAVWRRQNPSASRAEWPVEKYLWIGFGFLAVGTGFVLLSYYSVVGGWAVAYSGKAVFGEFMTLDPGNAKNVFDGYVGSWKWSLLTHGVFMAVTIGIVFGGVSDGLERAAKILMPAFGLLLIVLLGYSFTLSGVGDAFTFLFWPEWEQVTADSVLQAMGQSFFTLSLGMGALIIYGSYLSREDGLYSSSVSVAVTDTAVALGAGIVMFSIMFTQTDEMVEAAGPGLAFVAMPKLFAEMPGGGVVAVLFFLLLTFAAVSSAMSLLEVVTSYFIEEWDYSRTRAVFQFGAIIFLMGIPSVLGFSVLSDVTFSVGGASKNILSTLDYFVVNFALPLGGFGAGAFAGWVVDPEVWYDEIEGEQLAEWLIGGWIWLVRIVAPLAIVLVLLSKLGVFG